MKKRKFQNRIISELLNNYEKRDPICPHFLACGGCSYLDFRHQDQVEVKKNKLAELFGEMVPGNNVSFQAGGEYGYRTRMDYIVSDQGFGLRRKRRFDQVVDLSECHLIENDIFQYLRMVYEEGIKMGLTPYDLKTHEGYWRYLSVRINDRNQFMIVFVTDDDVFLNGVLDKLVGKITNYELRITNEPISVYHIINNTITDDNFGEIRKFWGEEYLGFDIDGLNIQIGPNTFFQNNIALLNGLIVKLLDYLDENDRVLDLYCGVGTLSLPMAKKVERVLGVELVEESIRMAKMNADINNIENAEFVVGDVGDYIFEEVLPPPDSRLSDIFHGGKISDNREPAPPAPGGGFNVLVVDPPRKGLEKVAEKLLEYDFEKIVYMSCNPLTLKKDLEVLRAKYNIVEMSWWDLYPQTPHVESLVYLDRLSSSTLSDASKR